MDRIFNQIDQSTLMACEYSTYGGNTKADRQYAIACALELTKTWAKNVDNYDLDVHMANVPMHDSNGRKLSKLFNEAYLLLNNGRIKKIISNFRFSKLILQEECVTRLLDEGYTVELVYLDFAKAFDSVNHRFLLAKLKSSGIDGAALNWIKSYVSNRSYQVQINGVLSDEAPCPSGVPKGSAICPFIFLLYIHDPPTALGDSAFLLANDVKWCSRDPNQAAFFPLFLSPGPGRGNGTYQSTPTNVHVSPLGPSLPFLRLSPR